MNTGRLEGPAMEDAARAEFVGTEDITRAVFLEAEDTTRTATFGGRCFCGVATTERSQLHMSI